MYRLANNLLDTFSSIFTHILLEKKIRSFIDLFQPIIVSFLLGTLWYPPYLKSKPEICLEAGQWMIAAAYVPVGYSLMLLRRA